jgi:hypothetical protein
VDASQVVSTAAVFVWLGMVLAISFLEAPLKFRAPGVSLQIGLAIGRLVFRALNACELAFAAALVVSFVVRAPSVGVTISTAVAVLTLLAQLLFVRPRLTRRSEATLAGESVPRSRAHYTYVGVEIIKVIALLIAGVLLLTS